MNFRVFNETMAQVLFKNKLVDREHIQACLREVKPDKDLGKVLMEKGYLTIGHYQKVVQFVSAHLQKTQGAAAAPVRPSAPAPTAPPPVAPVIPQSPMAEAGHDDAPRPQIIGEKSTKRPISQAQSENLPDRFRSETGRGSRSMPVPDAIGPKSSIDAILLFARRQRASDVHLSPNNPIILRRFGNLERACPGRLSAGDIRRIISPMLNENQLNNFERSGDLEFSYTIDGGGRFRVTLMEQRFGWGFAARLIPQRVRTMEEAGLPPQCESLIKWAQGMVLITGPLGCGKSSTLCTMVEMINQSRDDHIISIENPIEYVFEPAKCQITQRELNRHTLSQENALRAALRQDPDIIVVSELRDINSIRLAVTAAETGHLVLATMNTANATRTLDRIIDAFPPEERDIMRNVVSESLRGVISQQLLPKKGGGGVVPVFEILLLNKAVSNMIRKNQTHQLESAMMTGRSSGMVLLDDSLEQAIKEDRIEGHEAYFRAINQKRFKSYAPSDLVGVNHG